MVKLDKDKIRDRLLAKIEEYQDKINPLLKERKRIDREFHESDSKALAAGTSAALIRDINSKIKPLRKKKQWFINLGEILLGENLD